MFHGLIELIDVVGEGVTIIYIRDYMTSGIANKQALQNGEFINAYDMIPYTDPL